MALKINVSGTLDLNVSIGGDPDDQGLVYELSPGYQGVASIDSVTGVLTPITPGAVIVRALRSDNNLLVKRVAVLIQSDAQYAYDGTVPGSTSFNIPSGFVPISSAEKGTPNGVATLDASGKLESDQLPDGVGGSEGRSFDDLFVGNLNGPAGDPGISSRSSLKAVGIEAYNGVRLKHNCYWDGTNVRFINSTGGTAWRADLISGGLTFQSSTNVPTTDGVVTFSSSRLTLTTTALQTSGVLVVQGTGASSFAGQVDVTRSSTGQYGHALKVTGDTLARYAIRADGMLEWGDGVVTRDVNLYRSSANNLKTDDSLTVVGTLSASAGNFTVAPTYTEQRDSVAGTAVLFRANNNNTSPSASVGWGSLLVDSASSSMYGSQIRTYKIGSWTNGDPATQDTRMAVLLLRDGALADVVQYNSTGDWSVFYQDSISYGFRSRVTGESGTRFYVRADGRLQWGDGTNTTDTILYRNTANELKTDGSFVVGGNLTVAGISFSLASSTNGLEVGGFLRSIRLNATDAGWVSRVSGEAADRFAILTNGRVEWGDGTNARDTNLYRNAANELKTDDAFTVAGKLTAQGGIAVPTTYAGTATLVAGTVTVNTAAVQAGDIIMVSRNTPGGTLGHLSAPASSISANTSFVINSSDAGDTSTVNWWIIRN